MLLFCGFRLSTYYLLILELCQVLTENKCPQRLLQLALRDPSVFPTRIALFSLGTLAAYEPCREALLVASPSIVDLIRWFKRPEESPEVGL